MKIRFAALIAFLTLSLGALSVAQTPDAITSPYNAALKGTYTFAISSVDLYWVLVNQSNLEVGFCRNISQMPYGYGCNGPEVGQDVITGSFIADGTGKITSGTLTYVADPSSYECGGNYTAAPVCPYKVPAGTTWSSGTNYAVGDEVDWEVNGVTHTYQAAKANVDKSPVLVVNGSNPQVGNACANGSYLSNGQSPNCTWILLYSSAAGKNNGGSGTFTGTYAIQSNGLGTMTMNVDLGSKEVTGLEVRLLVPLHLAGQEVVMIGQPTLSKNSMTGTGTAVLQ